MFFIQYSNSLIPDSVTWFLYHVITECPFGQQINQIGLYKWVFKKVLFYFIGSDVDNSKYE